MVLQKDFYSGIYPIEFNNYEQYVEVKNPFWIEESIIDNQCIIVAKCDLSSNEMVVESFDRKSEESSILIDKSMYTMGIIDLTNNGERWEGSCYDDAPCGFGCLYDENNCKIYEGFYWNGNRIGYGRTYFKERNGSVVEYDGTFFCNKRHGIGSLFDMYGHLHFEGTWHLNHFCMESAMKPLYSNDFNLIPCGVEHLVISGDCSSKTTEFMLLMNPYLKTLIVSKFALHSITKLYITLCDHLEYVEIGGLDNLEGIKNGILKITKCAKLRKIKFVFFAIYAYHTCYLRSYISIRRVTYRSTESSEGFFSTVFIAWKEV